MGDKYGIIVRAMKDENGDQAFLIEIDGGEKKILDRVTVIEGLIATGKRLRPVYLDALVEKVSWPYGFADKKI